MHWWTVLSSDQYMGDNGHRPTGRQRSNLQKYIQRQWSHLSIICKSLYVDETQMNYDLD